MSFLSKANKKDRIVAIFDIGSGSVGGALANIPFDSKNIPSIIKSTRTDIVFRNELNFDLFLNDMLIALNNTANKLYTSKVGVPEEIVCVLASPWYLSETRTVKMSRDNSFIFTKNMANDLFRKELSSVTELYKNKYGEVESTPIVIENHVMNVSLDGQITSEPIGKTSKEIEMNMMISLSPNICLDNIRHVISNTYHSLPVSFSSFAAASYVAVRDRYMHMDSYILLDISGEITDFSVVSKDILHSTLSFPFGKQTFLKHICKKLNLELRDAKEIFNLYVNNITSSKFNSKIIPVIKSIENEWNESFRECINTLPNNLSIPKTIFLTADNDIRDYFVEILRNQDYLDSMVTESKFGVVTLEGPEFLNMCNVKDGLCDPFLMIEAIAIMRKMEKIW